jgi:hypothetical protein
MIMAVSGGNKTPDGKSLILTPDTGGWVWAVTPTIK